MSGTTNDLLRRLAKAVSDLNRLVSGGRTGRWNHRPADAWSAHQVLAHLRASNDILTPRIYQMLVRDNPPLAAFDERRWVEVGGFEDQSIDILFERISSQQHDLMQTLRHVSETDWNRTGNHEISGEVTVAQIVNHLVGHEEEHIAEIERLLTAGA
jgi:hypothetical protein